MDFKAALAKLNTVEQRSFHQLLKQYDSKDYKTALKTCDSILKTSPQHAESISMKGLLLSLNGKREEAHELAIKGESFSNASPVVWYFHGLIYQNERNYTQALKYFEMTRDKGMSGELVLRDISNAQINLHDYQSFTETRRIILEKQPGHRISWFGLIAGFALKKEYQNAIKAVDAYLNSTPPELFEQEHLSGMYMYKSDLLTRIQEFERALQVLNDNAVERILDTPNLAEKKAQLLLRLGKRKEAKKIYLDLLDINPECVSYHIGFRVADQINTPPITIASLSNLLNAYSDLLIQHPKSANLIIQPLFLISPTLFPSAFRDLFLLFLSKFIPRGVPSLFSTVAVLLNNPRAAREIERVLNKAILSIKNEGQWPEDTKRSISECFGYNKDQGKGKGKSKQKMDNKDQEKSEDSIPPIQAIPTDILFLFLFKSQFLDKLGRYEEALYVIERAIQHTPTLHELYMCKAKILKHFTFIGKQQIIDEKKEIDENKDQLNKEQKLIEGSADINTSNSQSRTIIQKYSRMHESSKAMCYAFRMDQADRNLNSKASKYSILDNRIERGEDINSLFTREDGEIAREYMYDQQALWYFETLGRSYSNSFRWGAALRNYEHIIEIANDIVNEFSDFQGYSIRKSSSPVLLEELVHNLSCVYDSQFVIKGLEAAAELLLFLQEDKLARKKKEEKEGKEGKDKEKEKEKVDETKKEQEQDKENKNEKEGNNEQKEQPAKLSRAQKKKQKKEKEKDKEGDQQITGPEDGQTKETQIMTEKQAQAERNKAMEKALDTNKVLLDSLFSKVAEDPEGEKMLITIGDSFIEEAEKRVKKLQENLVDRKKRELIDSSIKLNPSLFIFNPDNTVTVSSSSVPETHKTLSVPCSMSYAQVTSYINSQYHEFQIYKLSAEIAIRQGKIDSAALNLKRCEKIKGELIALHKRIDIDGVLEEEAKAKKMGTFEEEIKDEESKLDEDDLLIDDDEDNYAKVEEGKVVEKKGKNNKQLQKPNKGQNINQLHTRIEEISSQSHLLLIKIFRYAELKGLFLTPAIQASQHEEKANEEMKEETAESKIAKAIQTKLQALWDDYYASSTKLIQKSTPTPAPTQNEIPQPLYPQQSQSSSNAPSTSVNSPQTLHDLHQICFTSTPCIFNDSSLESRGYRQITDESVQNIIVDTNFADNNCICIANHTITSPIESRSSTQVISQHLLEMKERLSKKMLVKQARAKKAAEIKALDETKDQTGPKQEGDTSLQVASIQTTNTSIEPSFDGPNEDSESDESDDTDSTIIFN